MAQLNPFDVDRWESNGSDSGWVRGPGLEPVGPPSRRSRTAWPRAAVAGLKHAGLTSVKVRLPTKQGVTVAGEVTRGAAGTRDVPVARHTSDKPSKIVKHMLKVSDNDIADTLLRMTAIDAGPPGHLRGQSGGRTRGTQPVRRLAGQLRDA